MRTPCKNEIVKMKDMPLGSIGEIIEDGIYKEYNCTQGNLHLYLFLLKIYPSQGKILNVWSNPKYNNGQTPSDAEIKSDNLINSILMPRKGSHNVQ
jgi:hypothetical protein